MRNNETLFPASLNLAHEYARNYIPAYVRRVDNNSVGNAVFVSESYDSKVAAPTTVTDKAVPTKSKCPTCCGRYHYSVCWGPKKERSPFKQSTASVHVVDNNKQFKGDSSDDEKPNVYSNVVIHHYDDNSEEDDAIYAILLMLCGV